MNKFCLTACFISIGCNGIEADNLFLPSHDAKLIADAGSDVNDAAINNADSGIPGVIYHGGAVLSNVKVFSIYWGNEVKNTSDVEKFYAAITNSKYMDWLQEYNTPTQKIGRGSFIGSYTDTSIPTNKSLSNDDLILELKILIDQNKIVSPDSNVLYMIHFPAEIEIKLQSKTSCIDFGGYHYSFNYKNKAIVYGAILAHCNKNNDILNMEDIASHEMIEAITDPGVGIANELNDHSLSGWYDPNRSGNEIADLCEKEHDWIGSFLVQKGWSNQQHKCISSLNNE